MKKEKKKEAISWQSASGKGISFSTFTSELKWFMDMLGSFCICRVKIIIRSNPHKKKKNESIHVILRNIKLNIRSSKF